MGVKRTRKRKVRRRKAQHWTTGSAMNLDRRQNPERRAGEISGAFARKLQDDPK